MSGFDDDRPQFMEGFIFWATSLPKPVYAVLGIIGGIAGFIYGVEQPEHHPQYLYAIFGAMAGAFFIPVLALVIRFTIQCILVAAFGLAIYYAFFKP
jgi:hypothetical protein